MPLTPEEEVILARWRGIGNWGKLELIKQNGVLYSMNSTDIERYKVQEA